MVTLWHALAGLPSASSKVWMDAYLAAFAKTGGLQMVTLDQGFSKFEGISITMLSIPITPPAP